MSAHQTDAARRSACTARSSALGLVLGGVLTDANLFGWSWRSVFFVNVPVAVLAFVAAARLVPETRDRSAGRPDVTGAVLLAAALVAVAYPLLEGRSLGWPAWAWPIQRHIRGCRSGGCRRGRRR
jgi:MFS family permease